MAKYSTGGGLDAGDSCELCGAAGVETQSVNIAGAQLEVCSDCAQHDDSTHDSNARSETDRNRTAAQNTARVYDNTRGDSTHWESGADYDDDQLPYLVADYDERLTDARQAAGYQLGELASELDISESDLLALEQGRAIQAGVGGSTVGSLEKFLEVDLADED